MPRFLSESENGVIKLLISYSLLFAQLGSLGFPIALIKIFPKFRDKETNHRGFFLLLSSIGLVGFLVFLIMYFMLSPVIITRELEKSSIFGNFFYLVIPLTFFSIYFNLLDGYARVLYQSVVGSFLKEFLQRIFILVALIYFIFIQASFEQFLLLYTIALSLPTLILLLKLVKEGEVSFRSHPLLYEKPIIQAIASVSLIGLIAGFSSIAIAQIDSIMINFFIDNRATGIYSITFYYGTLVIMPSRAIFRIASTYVSEAFNKNDISTIHDIQFKSCMTQTVIGLGLFLLLWLNIENVFNILPPEYLPGKYVIFFTGIANIIQMASGLSGQIIVNSPYYRYLSGFVLFYLFLIIITNYFAIPIYGIVGAAVASAFSTLIFSLIKFLFLYRKYKIQPYNSKYFLLILIGLASYGFGFVLPVQNHFITDIIIRSAIFGVIFLAAIYYLNLSEDINQLINQTIKRLKK